MKVLVIDDEQPARERLFNLLAELPAYTCCGEAKNGIEALEMVQTQHPDIVLMDIRMPGMDGLETARYLIRLNKPPAIIFTTAYGEYALEAFDAHATGYLLKPIRKERLEQALAGASIPNRAQLAGLFENDSNLARTHICARVGDNLKLIPIDQILYFQADQKYVTVKYLGGEVIIEESLKSLEIGLAARFLRIHRNALVATSYIKGLEKDRQGQLYIVFKAGDERLEVSRRHAASVRCFLKNR
jgi:two-component system response regulator AlgR